jgi:hypothetical protein
MLRWPFSQKSDLAAAGVDLKSTAVSRLDAAALGTITWDELAYAV